MQDMTTALEKLIINIQLRKAMLDSLSKTRDEVLRCSRIALGNVNKFIQKITDTNKIKLLEPCGEPCACHTACLVEKSVIMDPLTKTLQQLGLVPGGGAGATGGAGGAGAGGAGGNETSQFNVEGTFIQRTLKRLV
ncbi:unnamed protein product [Vitrella brassicaformis CCMP3155]|uniref:Uncharacterized protein n=1 Tax=Vitrella brassicaformis (strain CCMP3155) TaxID=1169540 RepID=A0A0G4GEI7_VITBC|nr:unnamed protein product [Vitrella brassicaformis CCMP3155]|eukprot:CEM27576.1 unnamed protein product [Vitrella brassicaformis CCMP3155]